MSSGQGICSPPSASTRALLVDWLVDFQVKAGFRTETLFLAVSILDRFLATTGGPAEDLRLVAVTAAFIAAKFEELEPPEIRDFVYSTDLTCTKESIIRTEIKILATLEFSFGAATPAHLLTRIRGNLGDVQRELASYILEVALLDIEMLRFPVEQQVAAALFLSGLMLNDTVADGPGGCIQVAGPAAIGAQTQTEAVTNCAAEQHAFLVRAAESPYQASRRKYSGAERHRVAALGVARPDRPLPLPMMAPALGG